MPKPWNRAARSLRQASEGFRRLSTTSRVLTVVACLIAGLMMSTSALASRGTDLRPNRNTELVNLVQAEAQRNEELSRHLGRLRTEVDQLSRGASDGSVPSNPAIEREAGLGAVRGPAVAVTLTDAPLSVQPHGVDGDLLVVHQQDIQAVANALWAGGAEAMTIQGQRITSRTGIKCVGNTVVLDSVPYAPPYVIVALGDQAALEASLADSPELKIYREYVDLYRLGWKQERIPDATFPAYRGALDFQYAKPIR